MQPEALKLLMDIIDATRAIQSFTNGIDLNGYRNDPMRRAAVERKFEIIGEACTRLRNLHAGIFAQLADGPRIIGLRNRLIHGYDNVDDAILWDVVTHQLPPFLQQVESLSR